MKTSILLGATLLLLSTPAALAADESQPQAVAEGRGERSSWTFEAGIERRYDDNILQLTPHDITSLEGNPTPGRFLIETADDDIDVLSADAGWRTHWLNRRETRVGASAEIYRYQRNDVKNWEEYGAFVEQELTASQRHLATLRVSYDFTPDFYLREITDDDASVLAGVRIRNSLTYAQAELGVRYRQEVIEHRLEVGAGVAREHRNYNDDFNERDNDNDSWTVTLRGRPFPSARIEGGLTYRAGKLDARGDLPATEIIDDDISYKHTGLGGALAFSWGRASTRGRLDLGWQPERREYTTENKFELNRFGRVNHRKERSVRITQHVWGPIDVVARAYRLTSDATFPEGVVFDDDTTDFTQNRYSLLARARWN